jgi:hypothetical protein
MYIAINVLYKVIFLGNPLQSDFAGHMIDQDLLISIRL